MDKTILLLLLFFNLKLFYEKDRPSIIKQGNICQMLHNYSIDESKNLYIDSTFADYVNRQSKFDTAEQVLVFADSIFVNENVQFDNVNFIFVANYFTSGENVVTVVPKQTDTSKSGANGRDGKFIQILVKELGKSSFDLPGTSGTLGKDGIPGRSGNKLIVKERPTISQGLKGNDGQTGGNGGRGGSVIVYSTTRNGVIKFIGPEGKGANGGHPGKGGITYTSIAIGQSKEGQPDGQRVKITESQEDPGKEGRGGVNGKPGKLTQVPVTFEKFEKKATDLLLNDWQMIKESGWQIQFLKKGIKL